jgi:hypothetical protein
MMPNTTIAASSRAQTVRELHELIAALDRRVPRAERVGEISIARAAAVLKSQALKRIEELERDSLRWPVEVM